MSYQQRKRKPGNEGRVDDWLMTYADMITLLLCFFAIFLSISVPRQDKFDKARQQVMEHFASPDFVEGRILRPRDNAEGTPQDDSPYDSLPSIIDRYHTGEGSASEWVVEGVEGGTQSMSEGIPQDATPKAALQAPSQTQHSKDRDKDKDGDRIKTIDMPSAAFFASGSADLREDGKKILLELLKTQINTPEVKDYQVTIEGHTDDAPIRTAQFPSNWELSTARAAAVVRFFIENGVDPKRLRASGYADVFPKIPNRDAAGKALPENQAQNRRVLIRLEKIERG